MTRTSRIAGAAFLVGGVLLALGLFVGPGVGDAWWIGIPADLAIAVGFGALAAAAPNGVARVGFVMAAVGFAGLAFEVLLPLVFAIIVALVAAIGAVTGAIAARSRRAASIALLVTAIVFALQILAWLAGGILDPVRGALQLAVILGFVVTGVLFLVPRRAR
jgi:hypothetical protein